MNLKLTPKLTLTFVLFAAALLGVVNALVYNSGQNALERAAITELESIAGEKQTDIQALANDPTLPKDTYALTNTTPEDNLAFGLIRERVTRDLQLRVIAGEFRSLMLLDPQSGQILVSTDPNLESGPKDSPTYFSQAKKGTYISPLSIIQSIFRQPRSLQRHRSYRESER